jgi:hypothetical protein
VIPELSIDHGFRFDYELSYCGMIIGVSSIIKCLLCVCECDHHSDMTNRVSLLIGLV